jgi:ribonuclease BN (tRNA processing enzyme)
MRLTVLGAGPAYTDRRGSSGACYLVSEGRTHVLLDLGQGSFPRIFEHVAPTHIAAVVVSHLHPDHFIDLVPLRHYLRYEFHPARRVAVLGPADLEARLDALHGYPFSAGVLETAVLGPGPHRIGDLEITARLVTHTDESYAIRVAPAGGSGAAALTRAPGLVYSGDCGEAMDMAPLVQPGDTVLAEVSFGPGPVPRGVPHLDGPAVGRLATATGARRALLTHLQMGFDPEATIAAAQAEYAGLVEMVWPGTIIDL